MYEARGMTCWSTHPCGSPTCAVADICGEVMSRIHGYLECASGYRACMNVVDSSAWLEYLADGPNAAIFAKPIEARRSLIVPTLALFEVFERVSQQRGEDDARCEPLRSWNKGTL